MLLRPDSSQGAMRALLARAPTPLALLARRARNAKTGTAILQNAAQYLGEAAARLASAYWLQRALAERGSPTPAMRPHLEAVLLRGGSFGSFVGLLRESAAAVSGEGLARLSTAGSDALSIESLANALADEDAAFGEDAKALADGLNRSKKRGVLGLFEFLVTFRNKVYGHGALLPEDVCRRLAKPFLDAVCGAVCDPSLLDGAWLGRPATDLLGGGEARRYWRRLSGANEAAIEAEGDLPPASDLSPRCLYLVPKAGAPVSLSFWVVEDEDDTGLSRFGFFQEVVGLRGEGGAKAAAKIKTAVYLDYLGGRFRDDSLRDALAQAIEALPPSAEGASSPSPSNPGVDPPRPPVSGASSADRSFGDFVIEEELGRGAMGIVHRATQTSLSRRVALKVLTPSLLDDPVARGRFHREVLALARCDHPNVVRVLSSGVAEGRPWFAMELVDGVDLAGVAATLDAWSRSEKLEAGHLLAASSHAGAQGSARRVAPAASADGDAEPGRPAAASIAPTPPPPKLAAGGGDYFAHLAQLFAGACEGVEEIHRRGLVHRDIKPANLMLTTDGERLVVMDLGLAKGSDVSVSHTAAAGAGFVGSARYAAPEQIQSRLMRVDHRADVYSLGATLYELATQATLYPAGDIADLLRQKLSVDPAPARSVNPAVPRDLETILQKALARRPEDRYASAAELGDDLVALAEKRPIRARPPSAFDYLRLFYQRETRLVRLSAGAFVALVAIVVAGFVLVGRERQKALVERDRAQAARAEAVLGRDRAERLAVFIADDLYARLKPMGKLDLLEAVGERMVEHYRSLDPSDPRVLVRYEDSLIRLGKAREAKGRLGPAREAYEEAVSGLEPAVKSAPEDDEAAAVLAKAYDALSRIDLLENALEPALTRASLGLESRKRLADRAPSDFKRRRDVAASERAVALIERELGRRDESLAAFQRAAALHGALVAEHDELEDRCELASDHVGEGGVLEDSGRGADALSAYEKGLRLAAEVVERDPSNTIGWVMLASCHDGIGGLSLRGGRLDEALASYVEAMKIRERLARIDPFNTAWRADVSLSYHRAAQILEKKGDRSGARDYVERDLAIIERLAEAEPSNALWAHDLSVSRSDLGRFLEADGQLDRAREEYEKALATRIKLVEQAPSNMEWKRELAVSHERLGTLLRDQGKLDDALAALRKDVALCRELADKDAGNAAWQRDLLLARVALSAVLRRQGKLPETLAELSSAESAAQRLVEASPAEKSAPARADLARVHFELGEVYRRLGRSAEAERMLRGAAAAVDELEKLLPGGSKLKRERRSAAEALEQMELAKEDHRKPKASEKRNYNDLLF